MSLLEGLLVSAMLFIFLVFLWRFIGNKKFWRLFGISFLVMLFLFFTPLILKGPDKDNTPELNSQIDLIRWVYLGFIFSPSALFILKLLKSNSTEQKREIIPFYPLEKAIGDKFLGESIVKTNWGFEQLKVWWWARNSPLLPGARKLPRSLNTLLNISIPVKFVETKNTYYIDYRLSSLITFFVVSTALTYWLSKNLSSTSATYYILLYAEVELFLYLFYMAFWQLGQIQMIKKEWVSKVEQIGLVHIFDGQVPANLPVTLSENHSLEVKEPLSFLRKFILI